MSSGGRARAVSLALSLAAGSLAGPALGDVVLWNNGPLVNAPFAGSGGAHDSRLQSELGMTSLAFAGILTTPSSPAGAGVADDFVVDTPGGWQLSRIRVYSVPLASGTEPMSSMWLAIWNGPPWLAGSNAVFSSSAGGSFGPAGVYRVPGAQPLDTSLPVTAGTLPVGITLPPGHYWLSWQPNVGTAFGFIPRVPPVTLNGQATTGDGRVSNTFCDLGGSCSTSWFDALDAGTNTPQGFPFVIEGWPVSARKGDFDGQRGPDLVFRNVNPASGDFNRNKVWFMDGVTRTAEAFVSPDPPGPEWSIVGADDFDTAGAPWNGPDGRTDLLFYNELTGEIRLWLMNGTSRSGSPLSVSGAPTLPLNWKLAATADFNGDARADLLWRNVTSQKLVIWTMSATAATGSIIPSPDQAVDGNWAVVAAQDYNNDRATDLLWYNSTSGKVVTWYMNAAVQRLSGQFLIPPNAGDNNWKVLAGGDYSGTYVGAAPLHTPDVVWRNETSGRSVVWHLDFASTRVSGQFTSPDSNTPALDWTIVGPR